MGLGWLGSAIGGIASGLFGMASADKANSAASAMAEQQHQWNVEDFQHRYQWSVEDMRKAGLNPILAATNGIGGNVNGTGLASAHMAPTPDFASAFNSAYQTGTQKEIAKMQNDIAKQKLELDKQDIASAIQQRKVDQDIKRGQFLLDKWKAQESIRLQQVFQDAQIKNMADRLAADIEHMARMDANGAVSAAAAMAQANASGLMAAVQEKLGISREELNMAQEAYVALQSQNAEESLKWQKWLNDHPYTRGTVGFLGSLFDTAATLKGVKNLGNSIGDMVD